MKTEFAHVAVNHVSALQSYRPYHPFAALKGVGRLVYRSQQARAYACLMDLDPEVVSWEPFTRQLTDLGDSPDRYHVDFEVRTDTEALMVEVSPVTFEPPRWLCDTLRECGYRYEQVLFPSLNPVRIRNAHDLLRYARYDATLGDRLRVLAALDAVGTLTLADCLTAVREKAAMETIASLILQGHISVDLDNELLGPDTIVRRPAK